MPLETGVQIGTKGISCTIKNLYYVLQFKIFICKWCINYNLNFSTLENVEDEARQEEEHMDTCETTMLASTTEVGKEHSTTLFINKTLVIITKNINLTFLSYCS